jgi:hypothetical protein
MFADDPRDTPSSIWTALGVVDRSGLTYFEGNQRSPASIDHYREWSMDGKIVRRDVWIEVIEPPSAISQANGL